MDENDLLIVSEVDSFDSARAVYDVVPSGSELERVALAKMFEFADFSSFDSARAVYVDAPIGSELRNTALAKMFEFKPNITKLIARK